MSNHLTRFDPFSELARLDPFRSIDDLFNDFRLSSRLRPADMAPRVRMDVTENEQAYLVKAEVPGATKNDIKINIDGNQVTISADIQKRAEKKDESTIYSERFVGQYYRSFTLPQSIDDTKAKAEYHDGVLELSLPKKASGSAKTLQIH